LTVRRYCGNSGYSLVELLVAVAITGIASVSLLRAFTMAGTVTARHEMQHNARWLATSLKTEMDKLPVVDPNQTPTYGTEAGEWRDDRKTFDDIDDYAGWSGPPLDENGQPNSELAAYTLATDIRYVDAGDFAKKVEPGKSDCVLCRIRVLTQDGEVFSLQWLRTIRWNCYRQ